MTTPLSCRNYIDGQWLSAVGEATLESRNPADKTEVVATFPRSQAKDVDTAVAAARKAYHSWRKVPAPTRAEYIFRVGEILQWMFSQNGKVFMLTFLEVYNALR